MLVDKVQRILIITAAAMLIFLIIFNFFDSPSYFKAEIKYPAQTLASSPVLSSAGSDGEDILRFDINEVNLYELLAISGVGQVFAERILNYRDEIGEFTDISELLRIEGVGEERFEMLKKHLYINDQ